MPSATRIIVLIATMLLGACASGPPKTSQSKTDAFLQDLAAAQIEPEEKSRKFLDSMVDFWVQPANLTKACKIWYHSPTPPEGIAFYWDGQCKDGYAIGLGRAFLDSDQGLSSFLEEYPGGENVPTSYYRADHDLNGIALGDPWKGGSRDMKVYDGSDSFNLRDFYHFNSAADMTGNFMMTDTADDVIKWQKIYSNGSTLNFLHSTNEAEPRKFVAGYSDNTGKYIGYSIIVYRNGVVEHWDQRSSPPVMTQLPAAFIDELNREYADMGAMFRMAEKTARAAQTKLNIYTRRICTGEISVDYVDSKVYGQICLEEGDLSPYSKKIIAARSAVEDRRKRNEELARENERQLAEQQAVASQNAAYQSAQAAAAAQAFSQSMSEFNSNMSSYTQTMINNNNSSNAPTWGLPPERKVLNCFEMSNIITCR